MAANILNSPRAAAMSVYIIRGFVKLREDLAANAAILKRLAEIDKTLLLHDGALRDINQKLRPLLEPPNSGDHSYTPVLRMPSARGEIAPCLMKPILLP